MICVDFSNKPKSTYKQSSWCACRGPVHPIFPDIKKKTRQTVFCFSLPPSFSLSLSPSSNGETKRSRPFPLQPRPCVIPPFWKATGRELGGSIRSICVPISPNTPDLVRNTHLCAEINSRPFYCCSHVSNTKHFYMQLPSFFYFAADFTASSQNLGFKLVGEQIPLLITYNYYCRAAQCEEVLFSQTSKISN